MTHLNEWRALRDSYGERASKVLARRFHSKTPKFWNALIEKAKIVPVGDLEALHLYCPLFHDMTEWATLTRFCWLADKVWEMECEELAAQCTTWGKELHDKQAA